MNINTSTLLNMLAPKMDNNIKEKIQNASQDGKTNLNTIVKDSTIQTILNDTIKSLLDGTKSKNQTAQVLQNSKQIFDVKNLTSELKTIVSNLEQNPKLQKHSFVLKEFLINVKNIDENILKSNLSNSGINLESKLKTISILLKEPNISSTIILQRALQDLGNELKSLLTNGLKDNTLSNINSLVSQTSSKLDKTDLQTKIKTAISNLLMDIKNLPNDEKVKNDKPAIENIARRLDTLSNEITQSSLLKATNKKEILLKDVLPILDDKNMEQKVQVKQELQTLQKALEPILQSNITSSILQEIRSSMTRLESFSSKPSLELSVKLAINALLTNIKTLNLDDKMQPNLAKLKTIVSDMPKIENTLNLPKDIEFSQLKQIVRDKQFILKQEFLKELNILNLNFKTLVYGKATEQTMPNIKQAFESIAQNHMKLDMDVEQKELLKQIVSQEKILDSLPKELAKFTQNINGVLTLLSKLEMLLLNQNINRYTNLNVSSDLKTVLLKIKEEIESSSEGGSKELKSSVDKVLSQIEYFQTLSFTTLSNHTYLPFKWDDIEDADIKFSKDNNEEFSCQINLRLKKQGELKVLLQLDENKNININFAIDDQEFISDVKQDLQSLRQNINKIGLNLQSLNVFSLYNNKAEVSKINTYNTNNNLNFGLDVKV